MSSRSRRCAGVLHSATDCDASEAESTGQAQTSGCCAGEATRGSRAEAGNTANIDDAKPGSTGADSQPAGNENPENAGAGATGSRVKVTEISA